MEGGLEPTLARGNYTISHAHDLRVAEVFFGKGAEAFVGIGRDTGHGFEALVVEAGTE